MVKIFEVVGDITEMDVDAIVNSASIGLKGGGGVCGAIFDAAGSELETECNAIGSCQRGEAVITKGYNLPAKYIIHTVAPIWGQHSGSEPDILYSCYYESLRLADANSVTSIAFPEVGTGIYKYPIEDARLVAAQAIEEYFDDHKNSNINKVFLITYVLRKSSLIN